MKLRTIFTILASFGNCFLYSQIGPPPPPSCWPPPCIPIDGGVSILIAVGIAYGAKKINDTNKKNNNFN